MPLGGIAKTGERIANAFQKFDAYWNVSNVSKILCFWRQPFPCFTVEIMEEKYVPIGYKCESVRWVKSQIQLENHEGRVFDVSP